MSEPYRPVDTQCILHGCQTTVLRAEIERLKSIVTGRAAEAENARLKTALAFARSVIKSGEKWSDECERLLVLETKQ